MNFKNGTYLTAADKEKIAKTFERFLKSGLNRNIFTKALYSHLSLNFSFIAHYNIDGFYQARFGGYKMGHLTIQSIINASNWNFNDDNTSGNADLNKAIREIALKYNDQIFEKGKIEHIRALGTAKEKIELELKLLGGI